MVQVVTYGACGDKFPNLLKWGSGVGAASTINPTGWKPWAGSEDVDLAYAQAQHVFKLVRQSWNQLIGIENSHGAWPETTALNAYVTAYETRYSELKTNWLPRLAGQGEKLNVIARNIEDGACALELLTDAITRAGGKGPGAPVPVQPTAQPELPSLSDGLMGGMGIGLIVLLGVAAFAFARK